MAAESFQFGFANPANYSDWAKYAGFCLLYTSDAADD